MPVQAILRFPSPRLRAVADRVVAFDEDLRQLAADLLDTMRAAPGIGITASHIGVSKRLVVIELSTNGPVRTYINPQITWASDDTVSHQEGSVSMPGVLEEIARPARVRVSYQDLTGREQVEEADGLLAVCLQHEIDQLDGIFWINRLSRLKRDRLIKRFEKLRRAP
ncbi:MAG TPA: peptide deformylase [Stellaceae bacterium]|nr:peptide deformylase [Stellaceae bacterium]